MPVFGFSNKSNFNNNNYNISYCSKSAKIQNIEDINNTLIFLRNPKLYNDTIICNHNIVDDDFSLKKIKYVLDSLYTSVREDGVYKVNDSKKIFVKAILSNNGYVAHMACISENDIIVNISFFDELFSKQQFSPATINDNPVNCEIIFYVYSIVSPTERRVKE